MASIDIDARPQILESRRRCCSVPSTGSLSPSLSVAPFLSFYQSQRIEISATLEAFNCELLDPPWPHPPRYIYELHWLSFYAGKGKISALFNIPFPEFLYLCIDWLASQGISSCSHLLKAIAKLSIYGGERQIKGILRSIAKMFNLPHIL